MPLTLPAPIVVVEHRTKMIVTTAASDDISLRLPTRFAPDATINLPGFELHGLRRVVALRDGLNKVIELLEASGITE